MTNKWCFFQIFSRLAHQNCLIFCSKVNLGNTYKLAIFIFLEKFLIPSNPLKHGNKCTFLVSQRLAEKRPKESRPFVRPSVTQYLKIRTSELSEIWQLDRTWIGEMFQADF